MGVAVGVAAAAWLLAPAPASVRRDAPVTPPAPPVREPIVLAELPTHVPVPWPAEFDTTDAGALRVRVVGPRGPGKRVLASVQFEPDSGARAIRGTTNDDSTAALPGVGGRGGRVVVYAALDGLGAIEHIEAAPTHDGDRETVIRLARTQLDGVVLHPDGVTPAARIPLTVDALLQMPSAGITETVPRGHETTTDDQGRFAVGIPAGCPLQVRVDPGRFDPPIGRVTLDVPAGSQEARVVLEPFVLLGVGARDAATNETIYNPRVRVQAEDGRERILKRMTEVGPYGVWPPRGLDYEVRGPGPLRIRVDAPGYTASPLMTLRPHPATRRITVNVPLTRSSEAAPRLRLTLRNADGTPVTRAPVGARWSDPSSDRSPDGIFEIDLMPGPNHVHIRPPPQNPAWLARELRVSARAGELIECTVVVQPAGVLALTISADPRVVRAWDGERVQTLHRVLGLHADARWIVGPLEPGRHFVGWRHGPKGAHSEPERVFVEAGTLTWAGPPIRHR